MKIKSLSALSNKVVECLSWFFFEVVESNPDKRISEKTESTPKENLPLPDSRRSTYEKNGETKRKKLNAANIEILLALIGIVVIVLQLYTMKAQNKIIYAQKIQSDTFQAYTKRHDSGQRSLNDSLFAYTRRVDSTRFYSENIPIVGFDTAIIVPRRGDSAIILLRFTNYGEGSISKSYTKVYRGPLINARGRQEMRIDDSLAYHCTSPIVSGRSIWIPVQRVSFSKSDETFYAGLVKMVYKPTALDKYRTHYFAFNFNFRIGLVPTEPVRILKNGKEFNGDYEEGSPIKLKGFGGQVIAPYSWGPQSPYLTYYPPK